MNAPAEPATVLQLDHLTKRFGHLVAVNEVSFEVREGDIFGFLGLNGAGKSTTLYMIAGLVRATSGGVSIFGFPHTDWWRVRPAVGALLEIPAFYEYLSARKNLEILASLQPGIRPSRVDEVLEAVGLSSRARDRVGEYSHGMRQRLGIAQALLNSPRLLLLDEPTSGLDPEASAQVWTLLRMLATEKRTTIVISSHLLHEVEEGCNRIAVINQGSIVACDEVRRLLFFSKEDYLIVFDDQTARAGAEQYLRGRTGVEIVALGVETASNVASPLADEAALWIRMQSGMGSAVLGELVARGLTPRAYSPQRKTLKQFFFELTRRRPAAA